MQLLRSFLRRAYVWLALTPLPGSGSPAPKKLGKTRPPNCPALAGTRPIKSRNFRVLAVHFITSALQNPGSKTPGVDQVTLQTDSEKMQLAQAQAPSPSPRLIQGESSLKGVQVKR